MEPLKFVIHGQPYSKANRRQAVVIGGVARSIKSPEALQYERDVLRQIPPALRLRLKGPVVLELRMFYVSERSDMDESLLLDCLQDRWQLIKLGIERRRVLVQPGIYQNDRCVRERHTYFAIDRKDPRVEVTLSLREPELFEMTENKPGEDLPF